MSIFTEVWSKEIKEQLFPTNTFIGQCVREDELVSNKRVHHAEAGELPEVTIGAITLPATITKREDIDLSYEVVPFRTKPTRIENIEEIEVNYNLRQSVINGHTRQLNRKMMDYFPYLWAPNVAANILDTSGANRQASGPGVTGERKAFTKNDILEIKTQMDATDIPMEGRFILLTPQMLADLLRDPQLLSSDYIQTPNLVTGSVGRIFGFEIYMRSFVGRYAAGSTDPKAIGAANAADDNAFALAWQRDQVRAALGTTKIFYNDDEPTLYGSVFSTESRAGGNRGFENWDGVYAIREKAA